LVSSLRRKFREISDTKALQKLQENLCEMTI